MKPKILIVGAFPPPHHGSSLYLQGLVRSRIKDSFQIYELDTSDGRDDLDNLGKVDRQNVVEGLKSLLRLIWYCVTLRPAVVYLCPAQNLAYLRDGLFILAARVFSRAKIVQHLHGSDFETFYLGTHFFIKRFIDLTQKCVDRTIVLGESLKKIYRYWHTSEKITAIPNGIDLAIQPNGKFQKKRRPTLYFLGNLLKFKGFHVAIQALAMLKEKYPDLRMKIAGKWGYDPVFNEDQDTIKREIDQLIQQEGLAEQIEFLGPVFGDDKIRLLKEADIFVYPSICDGLPLVILEAMAAGNPVIAINHIGAIADVVHHQKTGILLDKQSPAEISQAIEYLLEHPQERIRMGKQGYARYQQYYTKDKHIDNMIALFEETLNMGKE